MNISSINWTLVRLLEIARLFYDACKDTKPNRIHSFTCVTC